MNRPVRVGLEVGRTWVFASAIDWPGWTRRGKGAPAALQSLADYAERYAVIAGPTFSAGPFNVSGEIEGNVTTDFGAPAVAGPWEDERLDSDELERHVQLLESSWRRIDEIVAGSPQELRKGPRGGGRDRDKVVAHVRNAERAYTPKIGLRIPPGTPWPEARAAIVDRLSEPPAETAWPLRYFFRRTTWHVVDHAWEIEDRRT